MKRERKTEIRVGVTFIVAIVILLWVIGWAKNINVFEEERKLKLRFDSVAGLSTGDAFSVNGVHRGYVESIENVENYVMVVVSLDNDLLLNSDAAFSIMMLDLMGGKKIEVNPGISGKEIDYTIAHNGKFVGDISTAMAMLSSVQGDLINVIEEVRFSLNTLNDYLQDEELTGDIRQTVSNLRTTSGKLNKLIETNRANIEALLTNTNQLVETSNSFINENRSKLAVTVTKVDTLLTNTNLLLQRISAITDEIENRENNIGKVMYDEELLTDLKQTFEQANELTKILIKQLESEGVKIDFSLF